MSVQRFDSYGYMPSPEGKNMRYDDHARIVAEATAEARAAERRHWEARFRNAEQAHAAALAAMPKYAEGVVNGWRQAAAGEVPGLVVPAATRTLTADDPPPSNESVVLDRLAVAHQRIGAGWYPRGSARGYLWTDMNFPVTLIHDGEDR